MTDWLHLIRAEYHEIPGLHLTKHQVQRLWNLDANTCEAILDALETDKFLRRTHTGAYVKRTVEMKGARAMKVREHDDQRREDLSA